MPNQFPPPEKTPGGDLRNMEWLCMLQGSGAELPQTMSGVNTLSPGDPFDGWQLSQSRARNRPIWPTIAFQSNRQGASIGALSMLDNTLGQVTSETHSGEIAPPNIVGVTRTGAGVALGLCTVSLFFWPDDVATDPTLVARVISDGSGNFSFPAAQAGRYELEAYKFGSPFVVGSTTYVIPAPTAGLSIYLRDPTVQDSAGAAVYRPIGSPVIRRLG